MNQPSNILIIGSKGFIGQHCLAYFSNQAKYRVFGCDVVVDYTAKDYFLIDASNADFTQIFKEHVFEVCINCSGAASVPHSIANPRRDFELNTVNVFKMLDAIRQNQPTCKFINLSSAAVYGNPVSLPINENSALKPVSPYGYHKWQSEIICQEMVQFYGLKTCSLRIFSAYGVGLKKQLIWDLYGKYLKNKSVVELYGTGKESRDFINIVDIVHAIEIIIDAAEFKGEGINIANGKEITIEEIAKVFFSHLDNRVEIKFGGENRKGDPINWEADTQLLQSMGYQQKITLDLGLKEYIEWRKELK